MLRFVVNDQDAGTLLNTTMTRHSASSGSAMRPQQFPITASTIDFPLNAPLPNTPNAAHQGTDNFILRIKRLSENGMPITTPGLNSDCGLYIKATVAVRGNLAVHGPGTTELVLDPTNDDGTPSATWDPATQTGRVGFSNAADDVGLATGSAMSCRHPHAALGSPYRGKTDGSRRTEKQHET